MTLGRTLSDEVIVLKKKHKPEQRLGGHAQQGAPRAGPNASSVPSSNTQPEPSFFRPRVGGPKLKTNIEKSPRTSLPAFLEFWERIHHVTEGAW